MFPLGPTSVLVVLELATRASRRPKSSLGTRKGRTDVVEEVPGTCLSSGCKVQKVYTPSSTQSQGVYTCHFKVYTPKLEVYTPASITYSGVYTASKAAFCP
jgi:hypothetical protein